MTDDLMQLDEHRPAADGSRPLQVGQALRSLSPQLLEGDPRDCWSLRYAEWHGITPPPHCRGQIQPGEHYILWTEHNFDGRPTGNTEAYCAACAIAEWQAYQVAEVTL